MEMNLLHKKIKLFLKEPARFRFSGKVIEESEGFLVIENDRTEKIHFIAKDNIATLEVVEE